MGILDFVLLGGP